MKNRFLAFLCAVLLLFSLSACSLPPTQQPSDPDENKTVTPKPVITGEGLSVTMIDVGQGDSFLLQADGQAMLIDAGEYSTREAVLSSLEAHGVTKIDYLVGTHPHADHIGAMSTVVDSYEIGTVLMPKASSNSKAFLSLLESIDGKGLSITAPKPGDTFSFGEGSVTVLSPGDKDYDTNNVSIVLRVLYGDVAFLFTGDAEAVAEKDILAAGYDVSAQVLKVGHHGSSTSTSQAFWDAVSPQIALISCGANNSYGHPHEETIATLESTGCTILRSDLLGEVTLQCDGKTVSIPDSVQPEPPSPDEPEQTEDTVILNKNSLVYHLPTCSSLPSPKNQLEMSRAEAVAAGGRPCQSCVGAS